MATIADTLNDIQNLQDEMSSGRIEGKALADPTFITELMNFTTVHFFELLSHADRGPGQATAGRAGSRRGSVMGGPRSAGAM